MSGRGTEIETEMEEDGGTLTGIGKGITRGETMMTGDGTRLGMTESAGEMVGEDMRGVGRESGRIMLVTRNGGVLLQTSCHSILLFRLFSM